MRVTADDGDGAGLTALAVAIALVWDLMGLGLLNKDQVQRLLDRALLALEEGQQISPTPRANAAARHYLEGMLKALERTPSALPDYQR